MIVPVEKLWERYENKYLAINIASLEARRLKELQNKGLIDSKVKPVFEAIRKLTAGKLKYKQ